MKKSLFVVGLLWGAGWVWTGVAGAKEAVEEVPKVISETVFYKDMSAYFYGQLPFLKKGIKFLDLSKELTPGEGAVSSLVVQGPEEAKDPNPSGTNIHVTKEFAPYVNKITSDKEATQYVMFLSRKGFPWMESVKFDYFQDVPFVALEYVGVSTTAVALNGIKSPKVAVQPGKLLGKKSFVVVRTVVPLDQPALAEKKILSGTNPIVLTELAEVTERVSETGDYSFTLRRFPVKQFPIQNPLINLRKPKK
ncbi:MAG: hypothetical protein KBD85_03020 [Elusimicrobia bacterium]|nr:hypothetical protein [Elusimicrobiota bacterium]MBP9128361.1 hypothetical protein [Elusimicrobiota bacterium]MBP9698969.1 hypothetical protein [Elusimicrobiota bacterium]